MRKLLNTTPRVLVAFLYLDDAAKARWMNVNIFVMFRRELDK